MPRISFELFNTRFDRPWRLRGDSHFDAMCTGGLILLSSCTEVLMSRFIRCYCTVLLEVGRDLSGSEFACNISRNDAIAKDDNCDSCHIQYDLFFLDPVASY